MRKCNICHHPVRVGVVHHAACWEREAHAIAQKFCDDYCRWPRAVKDEDSLQEHCDSCPLVKVLNLGL